MRLSGAGFTAAEIMDAVGCSFGQAQKIVRERNKRVKSGRPLWSDTGDVFPPPEARTHDRRTHA